MRISCSYAQSKLVSPFGRDVAQRQKGLVSADMAFPICFGADLPVFCPLSHLLRKCQLSRRESREVGANLFAPTRNPNLSLPLGEMSHSDREGWDQLIWLFRFALIRAFLFSAQNKREHRFVLSSLVGGGGFAFLRKSHAGCNMHPACCQEPAFESIAPILNFESKTKTEHLSILCLLVGGGGFEPPKSLTTDLQSAPFGHSGNLPYQLVEIVELVDGLEPPTC